ncbi:MAG: general secretion pathway protein GspB [Halioglobus sp.]|nr:general secretion pathway protein GspB [Halioglobus sp.]
MSLILDALNRARRDASPAPGVDAGHPATLPGGSRVFKYLPWIALVFALIVIAWLLLQPDRQDAAPTAVAQLSRNVGDALTSVRGELEERAAQAREQPPATAANTGAATSTGGQPAPRAEDSSPDLGKAAAPDTAKTAEPATTVSGESASRPTVSGENASPDTVSTEVAQLYREAASRPTTPDATAAAPAPASAAETPINGEKADAPGAGAGEEEPVDIEEILLRAKQEMNQGDLVEHPAPFLMDLSQQTRDEIPTVMYQRHNYGGDPSRSSVVLNGKTLRAGGNAAPGVTVDEILSESVILSFRGTQFRLRALNSWVNL